jgi:hypothetical protein
LSGSLQISYPQTSAVPDEGMSRVVSMRTVVVFPDPFGPRMPKISSEIARFIWFTAHRDPKFRVRFFITILGIRVIGMDTPWVVQAVVF